METSWSYVKRLAQRSEQMALILPDRGIILNDIKGEAAPSLDAWSTAAALAAVTEKLELMVAVRLLFITLPFSQSRQQTLPTSAITGFH
jgi:FMNH2-dependent dimethyl sulfone monooxygenase